MDVSLTINRIDGVKPEYLELVVHNNTNRFKNTISYNISSVHDLLFGIIKILFKSKRFFGSAIHGVSVLRNIELKHQTGTLHIPILHGAYNNKADYFVDDEHKGMVEISYSLKYTGRKDNSIERNNFVHKLFDLFLVPQKSTRMKNFNNLVKEASKGSSTCRLFILVGVYLVDRYMSKLNYENTYNVDLLEILEYPVCVVEKTMLPRPISNPEDLEGVLLRYKYNYKIQKLKDYLKNRNSFKIIKIEQETPLTSSNNSEEEDKYTDLSFSSFLSYVFKKPVNEEDGNTVEDSTETAYKEVSFGTRKWILKLLEDEAFSYEVDKHLKPASSEPIPIQNLLSNDGFVCAHKILIEELLGVFNFAIASYGNTWPTMLLDRKTKIDSDKIQDPNRRAILETLNIPDEMLLSVSVGGINPDHIIFFDKPHNRLVISFKGTSTSDETLHDLDCEYTTFYEGLAHRGIKRLAMSFVENRAEEILFILGAFKTDDVLVTGHSLGGSLASLVSIILNREGILKGYKITTISFSAPPVVSYNLVKASNMFTVNYGNDLIPRLSYGSVVEMKYVCCSLGATKKFIETDEDAVKRLEGLRKHLNETQFFPKLYHPGRVYQLRRVKTTKGGKKISLLLFKNVGLDFYENLLVIKHAPKHHMLNHISSVLQECIDDYDKLLEMQK
ncbi:Lipase [Nosema granulosis]|uniref:sn-1-specific diacylglycerol lipase n=1 Tax=Nosema granulosis TaxID=83296 RepID=A0A9P6KZW8_9MICR|nr:Lipase [Nosema granulosis]